MFRCAVATIRNTVLSVKFGFGDSLCNICAWTTSELKEPSIRSCRASFSVPLSVLVALVHYCTFVKTRVLLWLQSSGLAIFCATFAYLSLHTAKSVVKKFGRKTPRNSALLSAKLYLLLYKAFQLMTVEYYDKK